MTQSPETQEIEIKLRLEGSIEIEKVNIAEFVKNAIEQHEKGLSIIEMDIKEEAEIYHPELINEDNHD